MGLPSVLPHKANIILSAMAVMCFNVIHKRKMAFQLTRELHKASENFFGIIVWVLFNFNFYFTIHCELNLICRVRASGYIYLHS